MTSPHEHALTTGRRLLIGRAAASTPVTSGSAPDPPGMSRGPLARLFGFSRHVWPTWSTQAELIWDWYDRVTVANQYCTPVNQVDPLYEGHVGPQTFGKKGENYNFLNFFSFMNVLLAFLQPGLNWLKADGGSNRDPPPLQLLGSELQLSVWSHSQIWSYVSINTPPRQAKYYLLQIKLFFWFLWKRRCSFLSLRSIWWNIATTLNIYTVYFHELPRTFSAQLNVVWIS